MNNKWMLYECGDQQGTSRCRLVSFPTKLWRNTAITMLCKYSQEVVAVVVVSDLKFMRKMIFVG